MAITAQLVKELREKTGAGMMECKKALQEVDGDMEGAIEYLRKKGLEASAKKAGRVAAEGMINIHLADNGRLVVIAEINSETDFVAKNDDFVHFSNELVSLLADKKPASLEEALNLKFADGDTVDAKVNILVAKIGEKITFRRFKLIEVPADQTAGTYLHMGNKIGTVVLLKGDGASESLARDVGMHVAAASPQFLNREEIPQSVLDQEREIYKDQMKDSGKPENILDKIIDGKIAKYASQICLNDQIYVKDPNGKLSVAKMLKEVNPQLTIAQFTRYQVGEGIEKKVDDFAAEVSKMAQ